MIFLRGAITRSIQGIRLLGWTRVTLKGLLEPEPWTLPTGHSVKVPVSVQMREAVVLPRI